MFDLCRPTKSSPVEGAPYDRPEADRCGHDPGQLNPDRLGVGRHRLPGDSVHVGLLGVQRRFTWDIRPERHFIAPLLLLLLAVLFALHCRYAHVRADQAAAFAWQTIARYFLASMILILFLRPHRSALRIAECGSRIHVARLFQPQSEIRNPQLPSACRRRWDCSTWPA
jgi:hypothetical protein